MATSGIGISGMAAHVPPYRVNLADWCRWTGENPDKTRHVIGESFRMRGPARSVYTLAATAVLRLFEQYDIDPTRVRYFALGTESSTDNSAGAVIVKGMVDDVLRRRGLAPISRNCEVPEIKHACLGGVYALKGAVRCLAMSRPDECAIVVSGDIAEYERGSTGEPTQGAGALAMLVEHDPDLVTIDLVNSGSATDYRGPDFRKPLQRFARQTPHHNGHLHDFPVFNGKYSTACYVDETLCALDDLFERRGIMQPKAYFDSLAAVFLHRPYRRMAETAWALGYLAALSQGGPDERAQLAELAGDIGADADAITQELQQRHRLYERLGADGLDGEIHPLAMEAVRRFRKKPGYEQAISNKLQLGSAVMAHLGNLYTAALPAWLAAGLEEAAARDIDLRGRELLLLGYGSGDAAEAISLTVAPGWQAAAARIELARALANPVDLTQEQYESLHDTGTAAGLDATVAGEFLIEGIGELDANGLDARGIEYYCYIESEWPENIAVSG